MEFRYRANDDDRPPAQPPNPILPFLSARPIPGCSIGFGQGGDHLPESVRREIEKQQIRRDLIAAETSRRKELIAEVVKEMAIESEAEMGGVALETGMSLADKLTMWIDRRKLLPNQDNNNLISHSAPLERVRGVTLALEPPKEKLIVLKRPDTDRAKRKAEDAQPGNERAKRPCLDQISLWNQNNLWNYSDPLMSTCQRSLEVTPVLEPPKEKLIIMLRPDTDEAANAPPAKEPASMVWCKICCVGANSEKTLESHMVGKKHKAMLEKHQRKPLAALDTNLITTVPQKKVIPTFRPSTHPMATRGRLRTLNTEDL